MIAKTFRKLQRVRLQEKRDHAGMTCSGNVKDDWHKGEKLKRHDGKTKQISNLPLNKSAVARHIYQARKNAPKHGKVTTSIAFKVA